MTTFDGRVAFITGGGTGIGRATAHRLAANGCKVVVAGRREAPLIEAAQAYPDSISHVMMDLGDWNDQVKALDIVIQRHGQLDILINNAAIQTNKLFENHEEDDIARNIHVNLTSNAILIHKALPHLIATKGNIVNVSSAAGRYCGSPSGVVPVYSVSKAGLNHLTRILAVEFGPHGIRVNAIAPGLTDTEIAAVAFENDAIAQACAAITPLGRNGRPDDIAKVICFMASDDAGWVTGQLVDVAGGYWLTA